MAFARQFALFLLVGIGVACAQMQSGANAPGLPATSPTAAPVRRAQVEFADGKLAVTADNSSLNQILREVSRQTGMKITGTVADERVFGKYGPAPAAQVLGDLLEGTGANMLLRMTAAHAPAELILTVREGGVTPPNPNAPPLDAESDAQPVQEPPPPPPGPAMPLGTAVTNAIGTTTANPQAGANAPPAMNSAPAASGDTGTNPPSPGGAQTPQQIFEQLQRLQRQQTQPSANPQ